MPRFGFKSGIGGRGPVEFIGSRSSVDGTNAPITGALATDVAVACQGKLSTGGGPIPDAPAGWTVIADYKTGLNNYHRLLIAPGNRNYSALNDDGEFFAIAVRGPAQAADAAIARAYDSTPVQSTLTLPDHAHTNPVGAELVVLYINETPAGSAPSTKVSSPPGFTQLADTGTGANYYRWLIREPVGPSPASGFSVACIAGRYRASGAVVLAEPT